jgi:Family of unknown function (DUF6150)
MKHLSALLLVATLCLPAQKTWAQTRPDLCNLFGSVFVETNRTAARYKVYIESSEAFADLVVFKQSSNLFADRSGQWYFSTFKGTAAFTICFVEQKALADFSVFFTPTESFAGCKD